ncbi:MAG: HD domain-containing phosphohydrolase [Thermodesulfobacteriota bacterium]|nr:HD domain-containing phosphohydrolase [Thermodesulfobacteriota bacterium]
MVRFSDIIGKKLKRDGTVLAREKENRREKLWLSDSQILEVVNNSGFSDPFLDEKYSENTKVYFNEILEKATEFQDKIRKDEGISHSPVLATLHSIMDDDLVDEMYEYATSIPEDYGLQSHIISVTFASLKVGKGLGYDTKALLKLGLAAFLENLGMYKISDHILNNEGTLSPSEMATIRQHPEISAQIIGQMGESFQWLAETVLQVHERTDGSGYPKGLRGEEISEFASIIGVVDTYVAMTKNRPYRNKHIQTEAVKSVIELGKGKFPPRVVKEFLNQITLFPVNSFVKLNNKSIGRVLSTDKSQPLRPTIELIYDGLGSKIEERKIIHLSSSPLLYIVETIDENGLP